MGQTSNTLENSNNKSSFDCKKKSEDLNEITRHDWRAELAFLTHFSQIKNRQTLLK